MGKKSNNSKDNKPLVKTPSSVSMAKISLKHCFFKKYIYLFILAALGLRCCVRAFSSCGE